MGLFAEHVDHGTRSASKRATRVCVYGVSDFARSGEIESECSVGGCLLQKLACNLVLYEHTHKQPIRCRLEYQSATRVNITAQKRTRVCVFANSIFDISGTYTHARTHTVQIRAFAKRIAIATQTHKPSAPNARARELPCNLYTNKTQAITCV